MSNPNSRPYKITAESALRDLDSILQTYLIKPPQIDTEAISNEYSEFDTAEAGVSLLNESDLVCEEALDAARMVFENNHQQKQFDSFYGFPSPKQEDAVIEIALNNDVDELFRSLSSRMFTDVSAYLAITEKSDLDFSAAEWCNEMAIQFTELQSTEHQVSFRALDIQFHKELLYLAGSSPEEVSCYVANYVRLNSLVYTLQDSKRRKDSLNEHRAILASLKSRSHHDACFHCRQHLLVASLSNINIAHLLKRRLEGLAIEFSKLLVCATPRSYTRGKTPGRDKIWKEHLRQNK